MQKIKNTTVNLRIILAIAGKDILDGVKNRTILNLIISALILSAFFTIMPQLSSDGTLLVFLADRGHSSFTTLMARSKTMEVRLYNSADEMKADFIQRADRQLALVLPTDFDQTLAEGNVPQIQGYALNWVSSKTIAAQQSAIQDKLATIVGAPVQIDMTGGTLYMLPESNGGFLEATGIVVIVLMTGMLLVPNLMLEEKRSRTLEALLVSPANNSQIAIAKTLAGIFYVSIFAILVVAVNAYLVVQWGLLVVSIVLSILLAVTIGLLLGILIGNRQQLVILSQVMLIPLIGPILLRIFSDLLPTWLNKLAGWLPTAAMFDLLRISFSNQSDAGLVLPRLAVLAIYCLALLGTSASLIQRRER